MTYLNICWANCAGTTLRSEGACVEGLEEIAKEELGQTDDDTALLVGDDADAQGDGVPAVPAGEGGGGDDLGGAAVGAAGPQPADAVADYEGAGEGGGEDGAAADSDVPSPPPPLPSPPPPPPLPSPPPPVATPVQPPSLVLLRPGAETEPPAALQCNEDTCDSAVENGVNPTTGLPMFCFCDEQCFNFDDCCDDFEGGVCHLGEGGVAVPAVGTP